MASATWKGRLDVVASVATICVCMGIAWTLLARRSGTSELQGTLPREPINLQGAPTLGELGAPVALLVFTDYECPFCASFAVDILPELRRRYVEKKQLLVAVKGIQGSATHALAEVAERVGSCAEAEGKFWPYHDRVFELNGKLTAELIRKTAQAAGLRDDNIDRCMAPKRGGPGGSFDANAAMAKSLRIHATPWFFIGRIDQNRHLRASQVLVGLRTLDEFIAAIDGALSKRARLIDPPGSFSAFATSR